MQEDFYIMFKDGVYDGVYPISGIPEETDSTYTYYPAEQYPKSFVDINEFSEEIKELFQGTLAKLQIRDGIELKNVYYLTDDGPKYYIDNFLDKRDYYFKSNSDFSDAYMRHLISEGNDFIAMSTVIPVTTYSSSLAETHGILRNVSLYDIICTHSKLVTVAATNGVHTLASPEEVMTYRRALLTEKLTKYLEVALIGNDADFIKELKYRELGINNSLDYVLSEYTSIKEQYAALKTAIAALSFEDTKQYFTLKSLFTESNVDHLICTKNRYNLPILD